MVDLSIIDNFEVKSVFKGTNPNVTPDEITAEVNKSLAQLEAGDFEEVVL